MILKKLLCALLACVCLMTTLSFAGCGQDNGNADGNNDEEKKEAVSLKVWGAQDDQTMLREMCDAFAAANTDKQYTFSFGVVGEGEAKTMILDDPEAAADVFHFSNDQIADLVSAGVLSQIGGSYKEKVTAENGEGSVEAATVNGKLYAFPATADNGYFLYYNKAVFPEAPDTLTEILDACTDGRRFAMKLTDSWYVASFFLTAGCTFSEDKKIDFNSEAGLAAARAMNDLAKDPRFVWFGTDYDSAVVTAFGDGTVVACVSGTWLSEKIANEIGAENLGAAKLPKIVLDGEEVQMRGFAGYKMVGVNAGSKEQEDAVKLAAWLTNEENQMKRFTDRGMGPSNTAAAQSDAVQANEALSALAEQLQFSVSQNNVPASYWPAADGFGTDIVSGTVEEGSLQGMLDTLTNTVNNPVQ